MPYPLNELPTHLLFSRTLQLNNENPIAEILYDCVSDGMINLKDCPETYKDILVKSVIEKMLNENKETSN